LATQESDLRAGAHRRCGLPRRLTGGGVDGGGHRPSVVHTRRAWAVDDDQVLAGRVEQRAARPRAGHWPAPLGLTSPRIDRRESERYVGVPARLGDDDQSGDDDRSAVGVGGGLGPELLAGLQVESDHLVGLVAAAVPEEGHHGVAGRDRADVGAAAGLERPALVAVRVDTAKLVGTARDLLAGQQRLGLLDDVVAGAARPGGFASAGVRVEQEVADVGELREYVLAVAGCDDVWLLVRVGPGVAPAGFAGGGVQHLDHTALPRDGDAVLGADRLLRARTEDRLADPGHGAVEAGHGELAWWAGFAFHALVGAQHVVAGERLDDHQEDKGYHCGHCEPGELLADVPGWEEAGDLGAE
jgi:hypothetical protein